MGHAQIPIVIDSRFGDDKNLRHYLLNINPKPETLNSKQTQNFMFKIQNVLGLGFYVLDLFRISSLVFRVYFMYWIPSIRALRFNRTHDHRPRADHDLIGNRYFFLKDRLASDKNTFPKATIAVENSPG